MEFPKTLQWEETLSASPSEFWLEQIAQHTPKQVKSVLASHQPPDIARLESLGWFETEAAGVYAWILPPKYKPVYFDKQFHLLLGSTSQYGVGLSGTKDQLLSRWSSVEVKGEKLATCKPLVVYILQFPRHQFLDQRLRAFADSPEPYRRNGPGQSHQGPHPQGFFMRVIFEWHFQQGDQFPVFPEAERGNEEYLWLKHRRAFCARFDVH